VPCRETRKGGAGKRRPEKEEFSEGESPSGGKGEGWSSRRTLKFFNKWRKKNRKGGVRLRGVERGPG